VVSASYWFSNSRLSWSMKPGSKAFPIFSHPFLGELVDERHAALLLWGTSLVEAQRG
jgi:hypothetical protein